MKYTLYLPLVLMLHLLFSCTSYDYITHERGISFEQNEVAYTIELFSPNIVRVLSLPKGDSIVTKRLITDWRNASPVTFKIKSTKEKISITTTGLTVEFDKVNESFAFYERGTHRLLLQEAKPARSFQRMKVADETCLRVRQSFDSNDEEALYGLGQYQNGVMNLKGDTILLLHSNMDIANPFLVSTKGYGILWDNYSSTTFIDHIDGYHFDSEVADASDYYFVHGKDIEEVIGGYRELTGAVPMFPKWAFGFWQSKERYKSFSELESVVREYRKRNIPLDNIVQDWEYWGDKEHWNALTFNTDSFPNAQKVIERLNHEQQVHVMISVWPGFGPASDIYQELNAIGALFEEPTWAGYKIFDVYNPEAREIFWKYLKNGLFDQGVNAWWLDATEPSFRDGFTQRKQEARSKSAGNTYMGSFHRYLNVYSLEMSRFLYHKLREASDKRIFILTRSAFASQQKYATAVWSGDVSSSWENLHKQIPAGLNFSMSGIPYWTSDIGGFFVTERDGMFPEGLKDDAFKELYTRWFQFGAFSPLFRAHGTNVPREIWQFGEPGDIYYDTQLKYIELRYRLLPYLYSLSWRITNRNYTLMRGLAMDFPQDTLVHDIDNSYMFGPAFLVRPVLQPMKMNLQQTGTYLPIHEGKYWYDFWTGEATACGKTHLMSTPLPVMPLYIKGGSILPLGKVKQYAMENHDDELELRVYRGMDADFLLYDDQGEDNGFEHGAYATIPLRWNEASQELVLDKREGLFEKMPETISFTIKLYQPDNPSPDVKKILYTGKKTIIDFSK